MPQNSSFGRVLLGHREVGEDQQEDEEVVERQRALDQVDGRVVDRALAAVERPHRQRDDEPEQQPADAPGDALAEARLAPAGEEQQVDEQQRDDDDDRPPMARGFDDGDGISQAK